MSNKEVTYEVGEKVLIGDDFFENANQYVGKVGTIVQIIERDECPYHVDFNDGETATCWAIGELRKVES